MTFYGNLGLNRPVYCYFLSNDRQSSRMGKPRRQCLESVPMNQPFSAVLIEDVDGARVAAVKELTESDLPDEPVLVEVDYSSLNYKDGLALSGKGIARRLPMVGGIDLAGRVVDGGDSHFRAGERVLVNGWGLSEVHWGGYSRYQRLNSDWLTRQPEGLGSFECMAIGTAGYTAMLCVLALEEDGLSPADGEVCVTGAAGGVGSVAVSVLARLGYAVAASTGRGETHDYLRALGAARILDRGELSAPGKPFQGERWAGAIDCVGGTTLANVLAQMRYGASVAACGLAGGNGLPATVLPFILRGVRLLGIDSVMAPQAKRAVAWRRLASDLDLDTLRRIARVEPMSTLPEIASEIVSGRVRGRIVVDVNA